LRELRERPVAPEFGNSRLPENEVASAHMGESGVVGVTRRSERRSRFTLVERQPEHTERTKRRERTARMDRTERDDFSSSFDEPWQREEPRARTRRRSAYDDFEPAATYDVRQALYTEDDFSPRGLSGAQSRRRSLAEGLAAIPQAIGAALGWCGELLTSHMRGLFVLVVMAFMVFMLFSPVRDLYIAHRKLDQLQLTYDALLAENETIRGELEELQTREGIENEARSRGYVEVGETKVIVEGLPEEESDDLSKTIGDVEVPDTRAWYTRLFDWLFGYDPEA
jgi:hypothetical protein